jgi:hypothetical protein
MGFGESASDFPIKAACSIARAHVRMGSGKIRISPSPSWVSLLALVIRFKDSILARFDARAINQGRTTMRVLITGTVLLMTSALVPSFAQEQQKSPVANQPPMTAVQPERSPQQSEQSREQDRRSAEDVQVGRDWRAQQQRSPGPGQPSTTPVQPERSPQQSQEQDRRSAEDVQVDRDWRTQQRDGERMGRMGQRRMNDDYDSDHRTVGRNWQMQRDDERGYYDEDRRRSRVKICTVYENGDEFCRYRN